jgi:N6-L-threonylcarbamoyladenine synthase
MNLILGIETSCDETAASVVESGRIVKSNIISSQAAKHAVFSGVVPELAAREHITALETVVEMALKEAATELCSLRAVAVTNGPGLMPALLVGLNFARALARSLSLPLIPVNHFIAHIYGSFLDGKIDVLKDRKTYPILALVVSGGHTALVLINFDGTVKTIGTTLDDAAGEAFDKGARIMGLPYPGGPAIQKTAENAVAKFAFPRPLTSGPGRKPDASNRFNFSFSGLKTALLYHCKKNHANMNDKEFIADTAASYQQAIIDVLCDKTFDAAKAFNAASIVLCGGVACNSALRKKILEKIPENMEFIAARPEYCSDNAAMIASCAWLYLEKENECPLRKKVKAFSRIEDFEKIYLPLNPR